MESSAGVTVSRSNDAVVGLGMSRLGRNTRGQFSPEAEVKRPKCLKSSTQVCVPTFSYSFLKSKREIEIQGSTSFLHVRRQFKI